MQEVDEKGVKGGGETVNGEKVAVLGDTQNAHGCMSVWRFLGLCAVDGHCLCNLRALKAD